MIAAFEGRTKIEELEGDVTLIGWLRTHLPQLSGGEVKRIITSGKVFVEQKQETDPVRRLKAGQLISIRPGTPRVDPRIESGPEILFHDSAVVVAVKPTGILSLPLREERDSLEERVRKKLPILERTRPIPPLLGVHRLDKEASGVLLLARTVPAQRIMQDQFASHTVDRFYYALVMGKVGWPRHHTVRSVLVGDRGDGLKGSSENPGDFGKEAITHFEVLERFASASLLACQLETGRTHQIRIHAAESGHPIVGEKVYVRDWRGVIPKVTRLMLHATHLGFDHPFRGERLVFDSPMPQAMMSFLERLRQHS